MTRRRHSKSIHYPWLFRGAIGLSRSHLCLSVRYVQSCCCEAIVGYFESRLQHLAGVALTWPSSVLERLRACTPKHIMSPLVLESGIHSKHVRLSNVIKTMDSVMITAPKRCQWIHLYHKTPWWMSIACDSGLAKSTRIPLSETGLL